MTLLPCVRAMTALCLLAIVGCSASSQLDDSSSSSSAAGGVVSGKIAPATDASTSAAITIAPVGSYSGGAASSGSAGTGGTTPTSGL